MRRTAPAAIVAGLIIATASVSQTPGHAAVPMKARSAVTNQTAAFDPSRGVVTNAALHTDPAARPTASADAGGSLGFAVDSSTETDQGSALTTAVPGGGYVRAHELGAVARVDAFGRTLWQRDTTSLYHDWRLSWTNPSYVPTPQLAVGTDPVDPFELATVGQGVVRDTNPVAVGDLNGDGTPDVAVAETVGVNLGGANCFLCAWPFSVPGSDVHLGSFVTVLDGRTGTTLFSRLEPGFLTQLAIVGHQLIVGDETGDPARAGSVGQWGSATSVTALSFTGRTHLTAHQAWTYDTKAPWARLLGLHDVGGGAVALTWTDTPQGLGTPGPPDGHVVVLDRFGGVAWDRRTAGYPVLSGYDRARGELAVVEQTDPVLGVAYTLAALRINNGQTAGSTAVSGVLPTALSVGQRWLVAGVVTTPDQVEPPYYGYTAGRVDAFAGTTKVWSRTLAGTTEREPQPGSVGVVGDTVVVGSWTGSNAPSPTQPIERDVDLQAFALNSGSPRWERSGDVAEPLSLEDSWQGVRGVTQHQDAVSYDPRTGRQIARRPVFGNLHAAVSLSNGAVVAGGDSGAVYSWSDGQLDRKPRWEADLGGPVHQLATATMGRRPIVIAAATTELAIIDARTGRVLHHIPGQYVWNVAASGSVVVTGTNQLAAFDIKSGRPLWTYKPGAYFSDAAIVNGVAVAEYQDGAGMGAVGIDAATGHPLWTDQPSSANAKQAQLSNAVIGGSGIPGAGDDGVAVAWNDSNGDGTVDVIDARTGVRDYSNTAGDLSGLESYVLDSAVGLVAVSQQGSVLIRPSGPVETDMSGVGSAIARVDGTPVFLTASADVAAYPVGALSQPDASPAPLADNQTYLPADLVVVPQKSGTDEILTLPSDWLNVEVLASELGQTRRPYVVAVQQGLAGLHLTGTPAAQAIPRKSTKKASTAATSVAVTSSHAGAAEPLAQLKVLGHDNSGQPTLAADAPPGYDPAVIAKSLGLTGDGTGQTIAIVDAYDDPNIAADLTQFDSQFGLPAADLTISKPNGSAGSDAGWALETSMDVEWVHAVAPRAHITLVEAHDGYFASMFTAVTAAAALHPDAISMSWGIGAEFSDEGYYDHFCALTHSVCVASSGDYGYPGSYPAYNPAALAIGGTTAQLAADGTVTGEQGWAGSGGGQSHVEARPTYQKGTTQGRGIPDVSFDADPQTGVAVYDTFGYAGQAGWFQVGGTSLGAPVWSAILATADQQRAAAGKARLVAGTAQQAIYAATSGIADITAGPANGACPNICRPKAGYDNVTGLGSPRRGLSAALFAAR